MIAFTPGFTGKLWKHSFECHFPGLQTATRTFKLRFPGSQRTWLHMLVHLSFQDYKETGHMDLNAKIWMTEKLVMHDFIDRCQGLWVKGGIITLEVCQGLAGLQYCTLKQWKWREKDVYPYNVDLGQRYLQKKGNERRSVKTCFHISKSSQFVSLWTMSVPFMKNDFVHQ